MRAHPPDFGDGRPVSPPHGNFGMTPHPDTEGERDFGGFLPPPRAFPPPTLGEKEAAAIVPPPTRGETPEFEASPGPSFNRSFFAPPIENSSAPSPRTTDNSSTAMPVLATISTAAAGRSQTIVSELPWSEDLQPITQRLSLEREKSERAEPRNKEGAATKVAHQQDDLIVLPYEESPRQKRKMTREMAVELRTEEIEGTIAVLEIESAAAPPLREQEKLSHDQIFAMWPMESPAWPPDASGMIEILAEIRALPERPAERDLPTAGSLRSSPAVSLEAEVGIYHAFEVAPELGIAATDIAPARATANGATGSPALPSAVTVQAH